MNNLQVQKVIQRTLSTYWPELNGTLLVTKNPFETGHIEEFTIKTKDLNEPESFLEALASVLEGVGGSVLEGVGDVSGMPLQVRFGTVLVKLTFNDVASFERKRMLDVYAAVRPDLKDWIASVLSRVKPVDKPSRRNKAMDAMGWTIASLSYQQQRGAIPCIFTPASKRMVQTRLRKRLSREVCTIDASFEIAHDHLLKKSHTVELGSVEEMLRYYSEFDFTNRIISLRNHNQLRSLNTKAWKSHSCIVVDPVFFARNHARHVDATFFKSHVDATVFCP
jgi:hypothetical protein